MEKIEGWRLGPFTNEEVRESERLGFCGVKVRKVRDGVWKRKLESEDFVE